LKIAIINNEKFLLDHNERVFHIVVENEKYHLYGLNSNLVDDFICTRDKFEQILIFLKENIE